MTVAVRQASPTSSHPPPIVPTSPTSPTSARRVIHVARHELRSLSLVVTLAGFGAGSALLAVSFVAYGEGGWAFPLGAAVISVLCFWLIVVGRRHGVVLDGERFGVRGPTGTTAWIDLDRVVLLIPAVIIGYGVRSTAPRSARRVEGNLEHTLAVTMWTPRQGNGRLLSWVVRRQMPERQRVFVERAAAVVPHLRGVRFDLKHFDLTDLETIHRFLVARLPPRQAENLELAPRYGRVLFEYVRRDWETSGPPTRVRRRRR